MGQRQSTRRVSSKRINISQAQSIRDRLKNIFENPVYSKGVEASSIIDMIDDMILAHHKGAKKIRVPKPVVGEAVLVSICVDGVTFAEDALDLSNSTKSSAGFRSRRSIARDLRYASNVSRNTTSATEAFLQSINEEIENWNEIRSVSDITSCAMICVHHFSVSESFSASSSYASYEVLHCILSFTYCRTLEEKSQVI